MESLPHLAAGRDLVEWFSLELQSLDFTLNPCLVFRVFSSCMLSWEK